MKYSRLILPIMLLVLLVLVFTGCGGIVPSPGATEDDTTVSGQIFMPYCCLLLEEMEKDVEKSKYSGYDCYDETDAWRPAPGAMVELRKYDDCKVKYTTTTDEDGNYEFTEVKPGLYVLTTYCPTDEDYFLKDIIEKKEGIALDAGIPDCDSTSLAFVIEYIGDTYCHCEVICPCFNEKWSKEFKLVKKIAESDEVNMEVNIPAIIAHKDFGTLCNEDKQGNLIDDDLVDLVCAKLQSCCVSPGATGGGGGGGGEVCIEPTANAGNDQTIKVCAKTDAKVSFSGSGSGTPPLSYSWDFGDGGSSTEQNPTHTYISPFEGSPYTVTLTVTNECGESEATDTVSITITEADPPTANAGADGDYDTTVCADTDATINFVGSGTGVGDLTYEWDFESDGTYDSTAQNPSHDYPAGTYTATLRVTDDCSSVTDSVEIKIDEYSTPIANVEGQCYQLGCETEITATLSGSASGGKEPYTYNWVFGDGESASDAGQNPSHDYPAGTYTVKLTVTDACGNSDTDTATITVYNPCDLPDKLTILSLEALLPNYYLKVSFSDGSGDIQSSTDYYGWCAHSGLVGLPESGHKLFAYCTLDASLGLKDYWRKINWIINNRNGYTRDEVQAAIWYYINGRDVSGNAKKLVDKANLHPYFCPAIGEKFIVLLTPRSIDDSLYGGIYKCDPRDRQPILIEVERVNHCISLYI